MDRLPRLPRSRDARLLRVAGGARSRRAAPVCRWPAAAGPAPQSLVSRPTDIRIVEVDHQFEEFRYRAPYQFGGRTVDRVTLLNVNCRVRRAGETAGAWGFGSMTLGNAGRFPRRPTTPGLVR